MLALDSQVLIVEGSEEVEIRGLTGSRDENQPPFVISYAEASQFATIKPEV